METRYTASAWLFGCLGGYAPGVERVGGAAARLRRLRNQLRSDMWRVHRKRLHLLHGELLQRGHPGRLQ